MVQKNDTPEQLRTQIKRCNLIMRVGAPFLLVSTGCLVNAFSNVNNQESPKILEDYYNASKNLQVLESLYWTEKSQSFSYNDGEVKFILPDSSKLSNLEKAIDKTKSNLSEIENNSIYANYNQMTNNILLSLLGFVSFGMIGSFLSVCPFYHKRECKKILREKYNLLK